MEILSYSDKESNDEQINILAEKYEDDVDITIHFHCELCIKLMKCQERPKQGWSCEIINCQNGCGHRFHGCKISEHELLCSHLKVPCLNAGNGCPFTIQRRFIAQHLPCCPASVIICNAEWNRWAVGVKERDRISTAKGASYLYDPNDLDLCLAFNDQKMVNDMHSFPKYVRKLMCNDINKRFPCLPLNVRGSYHEDPKKKFLKERGRSTSTTDDEEEGLTPGLSLSMCTELVRGQKRAGDNSSFLQTHSNSHSNAKNSSKIDSSQMNSDDISDRCCTHGILKDLCQFCKNDPDDPTYKYGTVWRETIDLTNPASVVWARESRIEKIRKQGPLGLYCYKRVDEIDDDGEDEDTEDKSRKLIPFSLEPQELRKMRFQTPPPAPLTPRGLILELGLKHFSRHQVKPRTMFTFQCMQEVRRDEFESHYQNVHSEIQEGLDGWLMQRCPLHIIGCPFSTVRMFPGCQDQAEVIYSHFQRGFGIAPRDLDININGSVRSRSPSMDKSVVKSKMHPIPEHHSVHFLASSSHITTLPFEVLQRIARHLDGFSLNNLSLTCRLLRDVCFSQLDQKGLVIQEWIRRSDDGNIHWKIGSNRWFFSKCFKHVHQWSFKNEGALANHMTECLFNDRTRSREKFSYLPNIGEEIEKLRKKFRKL